MRHLPSFSDPNLLVGADAFSDAGVYLIDARTAIVQSVDFFPPLVDDPHTFGRIAAANALSDLYAMGATPKTAMNIVGFPDKELPLSILEEILAGGAATVAEAGAVILGGHSVRDAEIKYGLSVTGIVDPAKMMTNAHAVAGDVLILTKPIGTGFITTAFKAGTCPDAVMAGAIKHMVTLNAHASRAAVAAGGRAATDITGFGLAGHAYEMASASKVTIVLDAGRIPLMPGADALARDGNRTRAHGSNRDALGDAITFADGIDEITQSFLFDPQTSGGLLIAIDAAKADELLAAIPGSARVGAVVDKTHAAVVVEAGSSLA